MKKNRLLILVVFFLFLSVILVYFISTSVSSPTVTPDSPAAAQENFAEIVKKISENSDHPNDPEESKKINCFARLASQMEQTDFSTRKKERLQTLVDSWILNSDSHWPLLEKEGHFLNTFYTALAAAELLEGDFEFKNTIDPIALLKNLSLKEPNNSAPLVFLAMIYEKQGRRSETKKIIAAIKKTTYFDSHLLDFVRTLEEMSENIEDTILASGLFARIPIPSYSKLWTFAIKHKLSNLGHQMIAANFTENSQLDFVNTISIEYISGTHILKKLEIQHNYPSRQEYQLKLKKTFDETKLPWEELEKKCDLASFMPFYQHRLKFLKDHPIIRRQQTD